MYLYLRNKYTNAIVGHCINDIQEWDIKLTTYMSKFEYIQVKTVSELSTKYLKIKDGFNKLFLVSLDRKLYPNINRIDPNYKFPICNKPMSFPKIQEMIA